MKHRLMMLAMTLFFMTGMAQAQDIALGLLDNFNDETTQGWRHGVDAPTNPNPPTVIPIGGPDGSAYLENLSNGTAGPGSAHVILNTEPRWTGDYIAAGVNKVRVNITNFGTEPLFMRVGIQRDEFTCYVSTAAQEIPADATWRNYEFLLDASTMTDAFASGFDFATIASSVDQIRFLSAESVACSGDVVFGISGFDDIQTDADTDLDGINNSIDNCTLAPNPRQCVGDPSIDNQVECEATGFSWGQPDTDGDFYGNHCDSDIAPQPGPFPSGDCNVNFLDLNALQSSFFAPIGSPDYNPDADLVYNGIVNFQDLAVIQAQFFNPPGPGLGNCGCAPDVANDQGNNFDFAGLKMFIRGGLVLDWGAVDGINNFVDLGEGSYQARVQLNPGSYGYKIADFDWNVDYANEVDTTLPGGAAVTLNGRCGNEAFCAPGMVDEGQGNSPIEITEPGCYQFDLVAGPADEDEPFEADTADITVTGPLP